MNGITYLRFKFKLDKTNELEKYLSIFCSYFNLK